jgi:hypothetical protein
MCLYKCGRFCKPERKQCDLVEPWAWGARYRDGTWKRISPGRLAVCISRATERAVCTQPVNRHYEHHEREHEQRERSVSVSLVKMAEWVTLLACVVEVASFNALRDTDFSLLFEFLQAISECNASTWATTAFFHISTNSSATHLHIIQ